MKKTGLLIMMGSLLLSLMGCTINERALSHLQSSSGAEESSSLQSQGPVSNEPSSQPSSTPPSSRPSSSEASAMGGDGVEPVVTDDILTYGHYPQSLVSEPNLLSALNSLDASSAINDYEWYALDGGYYVRAFAEPAEEGALFTEGQPIRPNSWYWFKVEPIRWHILAYTPDGPILMSERIIDRIGCFNGFYDGKVNDHYANSWQDSEMENYLNGQFMSLAFSWANQDWLQNFPVDNSPQTTIDPNSEPNGGYTHDYVFLPSYADYSSEYYGLYSSKSSMWGGKASDYARAIGAGFMNYGEASYWLRSPSPGYKEVSVVSAAGGIQSTFCEQEHIGIRPMMVLQHL